MMKKKPEKTQTSEQQEHDDGDLTGKYGFKPFDQEW